MIVFNYWALLPALAGFLTLFSTESFVAAGVTVFGVDLSIRYLTGSSLDGYALIAPNRGGTLFWVIPMWPLGLLMALLLANERFPTPEEQMARLAPLPPGAQRTGAPARPAPSRSRPNDSHLIEPPPPPPPMSVIRVVSRPADAEVEVNGDSAGLTPVSVRAEIGTTAEIKVMKSGYVTAVRRVEVPAEESTVKVKLTSGRSIDIDSEPAAAEIVLNGKTIGITPTDVMVPARRFTLELKKKGYRRWRKRMTSVRNGLQINAKLRPLPLGQLPLTDDERAELEALREEMGRAQQELARAQQRFEKAKAGLARAESRGSHYEKIEFQNRVPDLQLEVSDLRAQVDDYVAQIEGVRIRVIGRLEQ